MKELFKVLPVWAGPVTARTAELQPADSREQQEGHPWGPDCTLDNLSRMGLILILTWFLTWAGFPPHRDLVTAALTPGERQNWTEKGRLRKGRREDGKD